MYSEFSITEDVDQNKFVVKKKRRRHLLELIYILVQEQYILKVHSAFG